MKDEEEDYDILVCARSDGFGRPVYGSLRGHCTNCKSPVWISLSGQKAMRENANLKAFCIECATKKMKESGEDVKASIVPGAIDELKRYFGKIEEN
jgi:hypothetical protein